MDSQTKYEKKTEVIDNVSTDIFETDQLIWYQQGLRTKKDALSVVTFDFWGRDFVKPELDIVGAGSVCQVYLSAHGPTRQLFFEYYGRQINPQQKFTNYEHHFTTKTMPFLRDAQKSDTRIYRISYGSKAIELNVFIDPDMHQKNDIMDIWRVDDGKRDHILSLRQEDGRWDELNLEERMRKTPKHIAQARRLV